MRVVIQVDEEHKKLIFSEKEAVWSKFSEQINVGDIFEARVGSIEDYGAFVHLRFPDVQDVRDILNEGDDVRVKSRITLSTKQLEEDPLLETLDKVIPQDGSVGPDSLSTDNSSNIEPLPGLEAIFEELVREDGMEEAYLNEEGHERGVYNCDLWLQSHRKSLVFKQTDVRCLLLCMISCSSIDDVRINRQGFEKRVVSQDLQLWLSNSPAVNQKFTLLARAGRQTK
ncbi:Nucleic acid-binding proteins superfamily [Prunus dulcis]|uniref:Nucleic acid-binding proteins superfamily n=1 Tax=Prunus dulcis TaxID=3755 RepID=A0A4Y1QNQ8_PRUDU|nr:Nucleic acid-binding proteins superfamily [Prunus dulcis]